MALIDRYTIRWSGLPGGPGITQMFGADSVNLLAPIRTFFASLTGVLPNEVNIAFDNTGDILDDTTGALAGTWTQPTVSNVAGTIATEWAPQSGMEVVWLTAGVLNRRRVRGRTKIVPMAGFLSTSGTPLAGAVTILSDAANVLASISPGLRIWHRPSEFGVTSDGVSYAVTGRLVKARVATLRSRQDS